MIRRADYLVLLFLVSILGLSASQVVFDYCQDDDDFDDNDDSDSYIMLMWRLFVCLYVTFCDHADLYIRLMWRLTWRLAHPGLENCRLKLLN